MTKNRNTLAVIWDYDGTLADTLQKNLNVTRKIIEKIAGVSAEKISALQSLEKYTEANKNATNWRDLYVTVYGLSQEQTNEAGKLWTEYQLSDKTPTPFYNGIDKVLRNLQHLPHGIVSQNAQTNIAKVLREWGLLNYFSYIVGYEEVDFEKQKPEPDGILMCLEKIAGLTSGVVFYIGDHEVDMKCALKANKTFKENNLDINVVSIGAFYGAHHDDSDWTIKPDYTAKTTEDIIHIIKNS
jgi:HAD superfamily hydrolase (TIGR01549 family)